MTDQGILSVSAECVAEIASTLLWYSLKGNASMRKSYKLYLKAELDDMRELQIGRPHTEHASHR